MLKILDTVHEGYSDGKEHVRAVISVNAASELVTEVGDKVFTETSFALVNSTGDSYVLTNGAWVKE